MTAESALAVTILVAVVLTGALWWNMNAQKRAARQILQRDRLYAMLSQCNQAIVHAADAETLLPEICRIACVEGRFSLAWIADYLDTLGSDPALAHAVDDPLAECLHRGQHVVVNDLRSGSVAWRQQAYRNGFGSMAA